LTLAALIVSLPYASTAAQAWRFDPLWTVSLYKQISGYSLLALALLVSLLSLRKRLERFTFARFSSWRLAHVLIGLVAIGVLLAHTGFRPGSNLNAWLTASFTGVLAAGGLAGITTAIAERFGGAGLRRLKTLSLWAHILLLWPLPALVGFHVLKGYYF
jgi:nitrite reductase (NADH) large subunit